eukprot:s219_g10.t1
MHFSSYSRDELGPSQDKIDVDMIAVVVKNYDSDGYAQDLAKSFGEEGAWMGVVTASQVLWSQRGPIRQIQNIARAWALELLCKMPVQVKQLWKLVGKGKEKAMMSQDANVRELKRVMLEAWYPERLSELDRLDNEDDEELVSHESSLCFRRASLIVAFLATHIYGLYLQETAEDEEVYEPVGDAREPAGSGDSEAASMEEPDADQVLGQASEEKPVADEVLDQASGEKPDANEVPGPASAKDAACMPFGVGVGEPEMISSDDEATDSKPIKSASAEEVLTKAKQDANLEAKKAEENENPGHGRGRGRGRGRGGRGRGRKAKPDQEPDEAEPACEPAEMEQLEDEVTEEAGSKDKNPCEDEQPDEAPKRGPKGNKSREGEKRSKRGKPCEEGSEPEAKRKPGGKPKSTAPSEKPGEEGPKFEAKHKPGRKHKSTEPSEKPCEEGPEIEARCKPGRKPKSTESSEPTSKELPKARPKTKSAAKRRVPEPAEEQAPEPSVAEPLSKRKKAEPSEPAGPNPNHPQVAADRDGANLANELANSKKAARDRNKRIKDDLGVGVYSWCDIEWYWTRPAIGAVYFLGRKGEDVAVAMGKLWPFAKRVEYMEKTKSNFDKSHYEQINQIKDEFAAQKANGLL